METKNEGIQPNTITYWEERTVNIGEYESHKFGISVTVKTINNLDKKVCLNESMTTKLYPIEDITETIKKLETIVRDRLNEREIFIRFEVDQFLNNQSNLRKVANILGIEVKEESEVQEVELTSGSELSFDTPKKVNRFK